MEFIPKNTASATIKNYKIRPKQEFNTCNLQFKAIVNQQNDKYEFLIAQTL